MSESLDRLSSPRYQEELYMTEQDDLLSHVYVPLTDL